MTQQEFEELVNNCVEPYRLGAITKLIEHANSLRIALRAITPSHSGSCCRCGPKAGANVEIHTFSCVCSEDERKAHLLLGWEGPYEVRD